MVGMAVSASAQTVSSTVLIEDATNAVFAPSIVSNGTVQVATFTADNRIQSSRSVDSGATWSAPIFVDDDVSALGTFKTTGFQSDRPSLYINGNNVYQIWETNRNGQNDLYFARSLDGGLTWEPEIRLDDSQPMGGTGGIRDWCAVVTDNGAGDSIYVLLTVDPGGPPPAPAFLDEEIYLVSSSDSGATFGSAISASTENGNADVDSITLAADGTDVHIAFVDNRAGGTGNDIFYRRSTDGGFSFDFDELQIDSSGPLNGSAAFPSIAVRGTTVAVGFAEQLGATTDQNRVAVSTDGGDTFAADISFGNFTNNLHDADFLTMRFAANGTLVAAWDDDRNNVGVSDQPFAAVSFDGGQTWQDDNQLDTAAGGFARIAVGGACETAIAWTGNDTGSGEEFRAAASVDGQIWSAPFTVSANTGDVDFAEISYDAANDLFVCAWLSDDLALVNDIYAANFSGDVAGAGFRTTANNPDSYFLGANPILGGTVTATVDLNTTGHTTAILIGFTDQFTFTLAGGQTLLCLDLSGQGELLTGAGLNPTGVAGGIASFSLAVPSSLTFNGLKICTQALHVFGVVPFDLSNAQDWVLGTY